MIAPEWESVELVLKETAYRAVAFIGVMVLFGASIHLSMWTLRAVARAFGLYSDFLVFLRHRRKRGP